VAGGFANTLLPLQMVCGFQEPPSRSLVLKLSVGGELTNLREVDNTVAFA
jgi:hypothetical protein